MDYDFLIEREGPEMQDSVTTSDSLLLTCWKDIARYMGKGVRTVQRWEQTLDLPVRRPNGNAYKSTVVARPADLDTWLASRWSRRDQQLRPARQTETGLGSAITASRQLRAENHELLKGLSSELQMLIQHCQEMKDLNRLTGQEVE